MTVDTITAWGRAALRFLMVQHPTRTSLGIAGGIGVATLVDTLRQYLGTINAAALTDFRLAVCGVFVSNLSIIFKKDALPESIEEEFRGVRRAIDEGKLTIAQQRLLYLKIAHTVIDRSVMSKRLADNMADVETEAGGRR